MLLAVLALVALYLLPYWVAVARRLPGETRRGVFWITLLGGWTGYAWALCLAWAAFCRRDGTLFGPGQGDEGVILEVEVSLELSQASNGPTTAEREATR